LRIGACSRPVTAVRIWCDSPDCLTPLFSQTRRELSARPVVSIGLGPMGPDGSPADVDSDNLFTVPVERIDFDAVCSFVLHMEKLNALTESVALELKTAPQGRNVVKAVAGLANADGGLVLVGVSEDDTGKDRLVGVDPGTYDSIISQLRGLLGASVFNFVEPVAVTKPQTDQQILVIRVDADQAPRPVVVSGTVYVRMPGQTVPARREEIVRLVQDQRAANATADAAVPALAQHTAPTEPMRYPFWQGEPEPDLTIRIQADIWLPGRAAQRPWLSSDAKQAALRALQDSPIPDRILLEQVRQHEMAQSVWEFTQQHSVRLSCKTRAFTQQQVTFRPLSQAEAYVYREQRRLGVLLAVGFSDSGADKQVHLTLANLYDCLLAAADATMKTCYAVADALDAGSPAKPGVLQGWLLPQNSSASPSGLTDRLVLHDWTRSKTAQPLSAHSLQPTVPDTGDLAELDSLVRAWLTFLWLDLGLSDFEPALDALATPAWTPAAG
jgi:hypothetical protein